MKATIAKYAGAAVGLSMLLTGVASAATFSNVQFQNGDVNITGQGRQTVQATFRLNVNANEAVECIETDVIGDSLAPVFTLVGGDMGLQQSLVPHDVQASVMLPPNTGTYTLEVKGHGIWGGANDGCAGPVVASASFSNALHVVDNGGSSTGGSTGSSGGMWGFNSFAELVLALKSALGLGSTTPVPTPTHPAYCAQLTAAAGDTYTIQTILVANGFMTQSQMNTGPGTYGPRTTAAHAAAKVACQ